MAKQPSRPPRIAAGRPCPAALVAPEPTVTVHGFDLPAPIGHLAAEIERVRSILDLAPD